MADPVYAEVRERDHYRCVLCGIGKLLEVHHITYRSRGGPDEAWNLITLCKFHHELAHRYNVPEWYLHMVVRDGTKYVGAYCYSCTHRTESYVCLLWEHDVSADYWCDRWALRDWDRLDWLAHLAKV